MNKIKVLIADDNRIIAENIQREVLKNDKFEVVGIANDGQEEYEMIKKLEPEIVFTDNQMPKMNGIDVIEKIEKSDLINKPKFVLITADVNKETFDKCAELEIVSVIPKPISFDRISRILEEIIDIKESPIVENKTENNDIKKHSLLDKLLKKIKGGK